MMPAVVPVQVDASEVLLRRRRQRSSRTTSIPALRRGLWAPLRRERDAV